MDTKSDNAVLSSETVTTGSWGRRNESYSCSRSLYHQKTAFDRLSDEWLRCVADAHGGDNSPADRRIRLGCDYEEGREPTAGLADFVIVLDGESGHSLRGNRFSSFISALLPINDQITKGHEAASAGATRFLIINNSCSSISTTSTQ